jgi:hypothetical protein
VNSVPWLGLLLMRIIQEAKKTASGRRRRGSVCIVGNPQVEIFAVFGQLRSHPDQYQQQSHASVRQAVKRLLATNLPLLPRRLQPPVAARVQKYQMGVFVNR